MDLAAGADGRLPSGRHNLPREFVVRSQRERMLVGMAGAVAEKGYRATAVKDVISRAGVSRKTFYENFRDVEDCFLAAYDAIVPRFVERILKGYSGTEGPWPEKIRAGLDALLRFFAAEPEFAHMCIVEVLAAGPNALKRRHAVMKGIARYLDPAGAVPEFPSELTNSELVAEMVVEGIYGVMYTRIVRGEVDALPALLPDLTHAVLLPYLGDERARAVAWPA